MLPLLAAPIALVLSALAGALAALGTRRFFDRRQSRSLERREASSAVALTEGVLDLYSLYEVGCAMSASLDLDQLLGTTLRRVADAVRVESCAVFMLDPEKNTLVATSATGAAAQSLRQVAFGAGEGLASQACRTRAPVRHASAGPLPWPDAPPSVRAVFAVPLIGRERVLGALLLYSTSPSAFTKAEQRAYFAAVGKQLAIALDNATLYGRATEMSYQDTVTGLFNRRYLEEALETEVRRAARYTLPLSLNMVGIDHFNAYNDTHGHGPGDDVLRIVARRLREQTRSADIVTRYGGDEFAVILPMTTKPGARLLAERLRAGIAAPTATAPEEHWDTGLTVSVGVAAFPTDASTAGGLLQAADAALYEAKARGRNRVEVFEEEVQVSARGEGGEPA